MFAYASPAADRLLLRSHTVAEFLIIYELCHSPSRRRAATPRSSNDCSSACGPRDCYRWVQGSYTPTPLHRACVHPLRREAGRFKVCDGDQRSQVPSYLEIVTNFRLSVPLTAWQGVVKGRRDPSSVRPCFAALCGVAATWHCRCSWRVQAHLLSLLHCCNGSSNCRRLQQSSGGELPTAGGLARAQQLWRSCL